MKRLPLVVLLLATSALAQTKISGTITAQFVSFSEFGVPTVRVDYALACSLTCDPAAPDLHYRIRAGSASRYVNAPTESSGYSSTPTTDIDMDGQATVMSEAVRQGSVSFIKAESVTCECGNRIGEGGYIEITSPPFVVPPWVQMNNSRAGFSNTTFINADLKGNETIQVTISGVITETLTLTASDFNSRTYLLERTPTQGGTLSVTATLNGASRTSTATIAPPDSATGGGGGGNSGSTGGGGGGDEEPMACSTAGFGVLIPLGLLLARRRAA